MLGCALGLLLVALNAAIMGRLERLAFAAPFRLSDEPVRQELTSVIGSQLAALRNGDFQSAYGFADSTFRREYAPAQFREMIRSGYPAIPASTSAACGIVFDNGRVAFVMVCVTGRTGNALHYQYLLRRERAGWKISAVTRVQAGTTTA